jgi:RNA polymerase sigma factor (sigma-70 family)
MHYSSKNFRRFDNPKSWILTIARNRAVSAIRKTSRETDLDENIIHIPDDADKEIEICGKSHVTSILSNLSQSERQIVILHVISELKHREIAKLLDLPLGTVCRKYNESIKKLQQLSI